jgi:hypothetical protein
VAVSGGGAGYSFDAITTGSSPTAANPTTNVTVITTGGSAGVEPITLAIPSNPQNFIGLVKTFFVATLTNPDDTPTLDATNIINGAGNPLSDIQLQFEQPFMFTLISNRSGGYVWSFSGTFNPAILQNMAEFTVIPNADGTIADVDIQPYPSTSGPGATVIVSGGPGATTGGNVILTPGSGGSGPEGKLIFASDVSLIAAAYSWTAGAQLNGQTIFTTTRAAVVTAVIGRIDVANGTAATLAINKCASGTAPGAGTDLTTNSVDLAGTPATNQTLTLSSTLTDITLAAGDSLCMVTSGTLAASAGCITVWMTPQ